VQLSETASAWKRAVPLRHAALVISGLNLAVRFAMEERGRANFGRVQEALIAGHIDDEILDRLKARFPTERCQDRPIFLPQSLLGVLRIVIANCDPTTPPRIEEDELIRYTIGRACLMMNSLLFTEDEGKAILSGTEEARRIELMTQMIAGFELTNAPHARASTLNESSTNLSDFL
jgi:hypothetical protein